MVFDGWTVGRELLEQKALGHVTAVELAPGYSRTHQREAGHHLSVLELIFTHTTLEVENIVN